MKRIFKAKITFHVTEKHSDAKYVNDISKPLEFEDTYTMDTDFFNDKEEILNNIKYDLKLVAGGGYDTENIYNVKFDIKEI